MYDITILPQIEQQKGLDYRRLSKISKLTGPPTDLTAALPSLQWGVAVNLERPAIFRDGRNSLGWGFLLRGIIRRNSGITIKNIGCLTYPWRIWRIHGAGVLIYIYIYANINGVYIDGIHVTIYIYSIHGSYGICSSIIYSMAVPVIEPTPTPTPCGAWSRLIPATMAAVLLGNSWVKNSLGYSEVMTE